MLLRSIAIAVCSLWYPIAFLAAQDPVESAAEKLVAATVTVRVAAGAGDANRDQGDAKSESNVKPKQDRVASGEGGLASADAREVTVCTGVSLGKRLLVTFHSMPAATATMPRIRVTLAGGEQAEAELRVIDRHSGLVLLEVDRDLPGLALAGQTPKVGAAILTAAAAGLEGPAVSSGILGAIDRSLSGVDLPAVLQCDLRTTETSSGAAVVDREGKLLGIVVATAVPGQHSGWTYALPVRHVERIIAAKVDGKLIELKRRRPVVGFTIGAGEKEGTVVVERVERRGPAAAAGIEPGDIITETDGLKIRSAYQAIDLILKKQPGDRMTFTVQRDGKPRTMELLLDGGVMPVAEIAQPSAGAIVVVGPQLKATRAGGAITVRDNNTVAEVAVDPQQGATRRSIGNEAELLRAQLGAYERVIESMQKQIELLRRETAELREKLDKGKKQPPN